MNKVIQIQLGSMVFTLAVDAYEHLHAYLESLRNHLGNQSSTAEIMEDIEVRMAELFTERLNGVNRTLLKTDVQSVILIMGDAQQMDANGAAESHSNQAQKDPRSERFHKLRRDPYNQSLGGVCAGIARYFQLDATFVRILFVLALVLFGSGVLLYIILWIVIPEATNEERNYFAPGFSSDRRLFRDPEHKAIGGVCSGIAAYFSLEITWIRIAFVLSFFIFGSGFLLYLVLWIVIPKASSTAQKLQMRGQSPDVYNISSQVRNQNPRVDSFEESRPLHTLFSIIGSIFKFALGALILIALIALASLLFVKIPGFFDSHSSLLQIPSMLSDDTLLISCLKLGVVLIIIIPMLSLLFTAIRLLFDIKMDSKSMGISLSSLFLLGIILLSYAAYTIKQDMRIRASTNKSLAYIKADTVQLLMNPSLESHAPFQINDDEWEMNDSGWYLNDIQLNIRKSTSDSFVFSSNMSAYGKNINDAKEIATQTPYSFTVNDNVVHAANEIFIAHGKSYRRQEMELRVYVPIGGILAVSKDWMDYWDHENEWDIENAELVYIQMTENGVKIIGVKNSSDSIQFKSDENTKDSDADEDDADVDVQISGSHHKIVEIHHHGNQKPNGNLQKTKTQIGPIKIEVSKSETK